MNLPKFEPKHWCVQVFSYPTPKEGERVSNRDMKLMSTEYMDTEQEAVALAKKLSVKYDTITYKGIVVSCTPKDFAEQRLEQIAEAIAIDLDETFIKEEDILAFDVYEHGKIDYKTKILEAVKDVLDNYPPEEPFYDYP